MGWTTCSALSLSDTGNRKACAGDTGARKEASCPVQRQFSNFIGWHLLYCRRHDPHPHRFRVMLINVHGANYHPNTPWTAPAFLRQLRLVALQATPKKTQYCWGPCTPQETSVARRGMPEPGCCPALLTPSETFQSEPITESVEEGGSGSTSARRVADYQHSQLVSLAEEMSYS